MTIKPLTVGILFFVNVIFILAISGCNNDTLSTAKKDQALTIEPDEIMIKVGKTSAFKAYFTTEADEKIEVTDSVSWVSSNKKIATINKKGRATGHRLGDCTITAIEQDKQATARLTVKNATLKNITLFPLNAKIYLGEVQQFRATGVYADNSEEDLTDSINWKSLNTDVVGISDKGLAQSITVGTSQIVGIAPNQKIKATTQLTVAAVKPHHIEVSPKALAINRDVSTTFTAKAISEEGEQDVSKSAVWTSGNEAIAIVDKGVVTGKIQGKTTISAKFGKQTGVAVVQVVKKDVDHLVITPEDEMIPVGIERQFQARAIYTNNNEDDITPDAAWSVENAAVATVNNQGKVIAKKRGTTQISASFLGKTVKTFVIVHHGVLKKLTILPEGKAANFVVGLKNQLNAVGIFSNDIVADMTREVTWESQSPTILSVEPSGSEAGLAEAKSKGVAVIKATPSDSKRSATMTYQVKDVVLQSINISPEDPKIPKNHDITFTATGSYTDGAVRELKEDVFWKSQDIEVADISTSGKATATAIGKAIIEASYKQKQATTTLKVIDSEGIDKIVITPDNATIRPLSVISFKAIAVFNDGTELDVTKTGIWRSSNSTIVWILNTLWSDGIAYSLVLQGAVDISMTYKGVTEKVLLTVR